MLVQYMYTASDSKKGKQDLQPSIFQELGGKERGQGCWDGVQRHACDWITPTAMERKINHFGLSDMQPSAALFHHLVDSDLSGHRPSPFQGQNATGWPQNLHDTHELISPVLSEMNRRYRCGS